ncbi:MAG: prefoldin subunit alpha [Thermoplasmata archaeon]|nr:prefoldin subunit alpha [Thermoplasmata archaeon]
MSEEEISRNIYLLQRYQEQVEEIYGELDFLDKLMQEYTRSIETMQEIINSSSSEILVPIGGNAFAYGELKDREKVLVNVGGGVFVEKSLNAAMETINRRMEELKKSQEKLIATVEEIRQKMDDIASGLRERDVPVSEKED